MKIKKWPNQSPDIFFTDYEMAENKREEERVLRDDSGCNRTPPSIWEYNSPISFCFKYHQEFYFKYQ